MVAAGCRLITTTRRTLDDIVLDATSGRAAALASGALEIEGDASQLQRCSGMPRSAAGMMFDILTPATA